MIALAHQFRVQLPVDEAWALLTDLPQVAACLPGAQLEDVIDGTYRGKVSTRIGPVNANYHGVAFFREHDDVANRAVVEARGKETRGAGIAFAVITLQLSPAGGATLVEVATDLSISGRAAQFGRSLLAEVSNSLVEDFVRSLEAMIAEGSSPSPSSNGHAPQSSATRAGGSTPAPAANAEQPSLDVLSTVAAPLARRAAVPLAAAVIGGILGVLFGRRRKSAPR